MEAPLLIVLDQGGGEAVILLQPLHKNFLVIIVPSDKTRVILYQLQELDSANVVAHLTRGSPVMSSTPGTRGGWNSSW